MSKRLMYRRSVIADDSDEPGSPEQLARVAAHERGVSDLEELRRLEAKRAEDATPAGRTARALERIADALERIAPAHRSAPV